MSNEENKVEGEVNEETVVEETASEEVNDASEPTQVDGSDLPEGGEVVNGEAPVEPSQENATEPEVESEVADAPEKVPSTAVYDSTGHLVRTYDAETHGEGYHDLAVQFAASEGHTVKEI